MRRTASYSRLSRLVHSMNASQTASASSSVGSRSAIVCARISATGTAVRSSSIASGLVDPTDAVALNAAPRPLAARAVRRWLDRDGYPPDAAGIARVLAVAAGESVACEVAGRGRIERQDGRLVLYPTERASG